MDRRRTAETSGPSRLPLVACVLAVACALPFHAGRADPPASAETPGAADSVPHDATLEASGAVIGTITLVRDNVFDTTLPGEDYALYRLANRWHMVTHESVIRSQLLFGSGDAYSRRVLDESARLLRRNDYLYDAKIEPIRYEDGVVDIVVQTKDVWSLTPEVSFSRTGGENKWRVGIAEQNLLGRGSRLRLSYEENVDRDSAVFEFRDNNLLRSRTQLALELVDSSDGHERLFLLQRPFYSLNARWAAATSLFDTDAETRFFELGDEVAEYREERRFLSAFGGWSAGLRNGWVRRWSAGLVYDDSQFSEVPEPTLPALIPDDRMFLYPFLAFELIEDDYHTSTNRDQIERTEDFLIGTRLAASLGIASESVESDRDALLYSAGFSRGFGSIEKKALLLSAVVSGRVDDGDAANTLLNVKARYYSQQSKKRLFFMAIDGAWGSDLDLDNLQDLGGDSGLRGYPLRYQTGDSRLLFTIEQRYYTDWYPFRLVRIGFAAFADTGRTWGTNPAGGEPLGWLSDVGFGLRAVSTRSSSGDVYHFDVAFPLDGDPSIDDVQFIVESKRSF